MTRGGPAMKHPPGRFTTRTDYPAACGAIGPLIEVALGRISLPGKLVSSRVSNGRRDFGAP
jgi:hypothetical protein